MFNFTSYHKADSIDEAIQTLAKNPQAIPLAGGTDVLISLRKGYEGYGHVVDIVNIPELKSISMDADGTIIIGATATFTDLLTDPIITSHLPILVQTSASVAGPQIRNVATVGGNICNGAPSADSAAPLLVHNAVVLLQGPEGERRVPLEDFYLSVGRVDRRQAEIMTGLSIAPKDYRDLQSTYIKYAMRQAMDIATIGCAGGVKVVDGLLKDLRLAYIVAGPTPLRCPTAEAKARELAADATTIEMVAQSVLADLKPRDSWRANKDFREHIIKVLANRVMLEILEMGGVKIS